MPDTQASTTIAEPRPSEIQGLVDNIQGSRVFGWAWNPARPAERVTVELRIGAATVATTQAAAERADLQGAGVGDGHHAFDFALKPEWIARRADLFVVARTADGLEAPLPLLGARPALAAVPDAPAPPAVSLTRAVQSLAREQQSTQERLQAALRQIADLDGGATALPDMRARIETLELWCLRLDDRLATLVGGDIRAVAPRRTLDGWQIALGVAVLAGFGVALLVSRFGGIHLPGFG